MAMSIRAIIEDGASKGLVRLNKVSSKSVNQTLAIHALKIQSIARRSLVTGPKTGRVYKRRSVIHRASAPGQTPASDTGNLLNHIIVTFGKDYADVGATVRHGKHLEEKKPTAGGRPWLAPATKKGMAKAEGTLVARLDKNL
jgi:hypothetical protein